jgi:hypothetical protein
VKLSRDLLIAYVEGSLPPEDARAVAAEVAKDGALYAYVEEQKQLNARLGTVFAPRADATPPAPSSRPQTAELTSAPEPAPKPKSAFAARFRFAWPDRLAAHWVPAVATAAGIALGVMLAGSFGMGSDIRAQGGRLTAQGDLARILTSQLAADQSDAAPVRVLASFVDKDGFFCRSFETDGPGGALSGIACRDNGVWRIAALAAAERREATALRPAGLETPASIRAAMGAAMVGEPLSAEAERAARAQGWRPH